jgi:hypothetical protein
LRSAGTGEGLLLLLLPEGVAGESLAPGAAGVAGLGLGMVGITTGDGKGVTTGAASSDSLGVGDGDVAAGSCVGVGLLSVVSGVGLAPYTSVGIGLLVPMPTTPCVLSSCWAGVGLLAGPSVAVGSVVVGAVVVGGASGVGDGDAVPR